jgi:flagellar protein FliS
MNNPRLAYQEAAVRGASPVRLTVLLYEQVIQDLTRAIDAITQRKAENCAHELNHATSVVGYLHATLNPNAGASVTRNLGRFYTMIREKLLEAQVRSSREILEELRGHMLDVREAWLKVEADSAK